MFGSIVSGFCGRDEPPARPVRLRQRIVNVRIAFDSRHVLPASQRFSYFTAAFHQDRVNNVKGAMLDPAFTQPLQDRSLCCLALVPKRIINVATFFRLRR